MTLLLSFLLLGLVPILSFGQDTEQILYIPWPDGWELVNQSQTDKRIDLQFYKQGEDIKNWNQAGLISVIKNKQFANLEEFVLDNNSVLLTNCAKVNHKIIKHQKDGAMPYVMYTFNYEDCAQGPNGELKQPSKPQAWLCIVVQGPTDVFIGQFGIKQKDFSPMPEALMKNWVKILASGRIVDVPKQAK